MSAAYETPVTVSPEKLLERIAELERHRTTLQETNTKYVEEVRRYHVELRDSKAREAPIWMMPAIERARAHGRFADGNHVVGVIFEEFHEFAHEVHLKNPGGMRRELIDIAGACLKAIGQMDGGDL